MKKTTPYLITAAFLAVLVFHACKKEISCESCLGVNKPPIAKAGVDQTITLPKDSVLLDGTASIDPDDAITSYKWVKILGHVSANIANVASSKSLVKSLVAGVYQFELTVTDNGGLSAKDTVQVMVDAPGNQPPVACAGADQTITLPTNAVTLDGSCSADPDNNIASYAWSKLAGPSTFNFTNANVLQTQVTNLVQGVYQFELKVTDVGGLIDKDTLQIIVNAAATMVACSNDNRPTVNARLIRLGTLSEPRSLICVAATGNKILFNGGVLASCEGSGKVDIYDIAANTWSVAERPLGSDFFGGSGDYGMAVAVSGSKLFFAGGDNLVGCTDYGASTLLTYDVTTTTWDISAKSIPGWNIAAASVGNKVLFAGGSEYSSNNRATKVEVYNLSANSWSSASLSEQRNYGHAAISVNNKIYIAGGVGANGLSSTIDIYDNTTNTWSTANMQKGRAYFGAIAVNDKLYLAGGLRQASDYNSASCEVEIIDINTGASVIEFLSRPAKWNIVLGQNIVMKDNKIIFIRFDRSADADKFDIYDINTKSWSIGVLPQAIPMDASVISVNNTIYIAGGLVNGTMSDQVWKLEF